MNKYPMITDNYLASYFSASTGRLRSWQERATWAIFETDPRGKSANYAPFRRQGYHGRGPPIRRLGLPKAPLPFRSPYGYLWAAA